MKDNIRFILFGIFFLLNSLLGFGGNPAEQQTEDYQLRRPADGFLEDCRDDPAFVYTRQPEESSDWLQGWISRLMERVPGISRLGLWMRWLVKIVAVGAVIFAVYWLVRSGRSNPFGRRVRKYQSENIFIPEEIDELSYPLMLEKAIAEGNFSLAICIRHAYMLRILDVKGFIRRDDRKTNSDYAMEITDNSLSTEFRYLSRIFECVCYGEFPVNEDIYRDIETCFSEFQKKIGA